MSEILSDERIAKMQQDGFVPDIYLVLASHRALQAKLTALEELQAKNEGRIKHIVDEHLQARITALENAIRNEPELPGEIPQEMFETIKTLDKQGTEEWCRIIVRKTKESILRNAEPTETKTAC